MIGRRVPPRSATEPELDLQPGDYCGPVDENGRPAVYFLLPIARDEDVPAGARSVHKVCSPPHGFRECADGSLEIQGSIGCGLAPYYWHGYLDEGHSWRRVG